MTAPLSECKAAPGGAGSVAKDGNSAGVRLHQSTCVIALTQSQAKPRVNTRYFLVEVGVGWLQCLPAQPAMRTQRELGVFHAGPSRVAPSFCLATTTSLS